MSPVAHWILGIFSLLFAATFIPTVMDDPTNLAWWGILIFLSLIAVACFFPRHRKFSLRIIGGTIFGVCLAFLIDSFKQGDWTEAIKAFMIFGLPGFYVAVLGNYPIWGKASQVFDSKHKTR